MGRPTTRPRSVLSYAVIELRRVLGETQQQFAARLGTAVTTIARWETSRSPNGKALGKLFTAATETGRVDLLGIFLTALQREFGVKVPSRSPTFLEAHYETELGNILALVDVLDEPGVTVEKAVNARKSIREIVNNLLWDEFRDAPMIDMEGAEEVVYKPGESG